MSAQVNGAARIRKGRTDFANAPLFAYTDNQKLSIAQIPTDHRLDDKLVGTLAYGAAKGHYMRRRLSVFEWCFDRNGHLLKKRDSCGRPFIDHQHRAMTVEGIVMGGALNIAAGPYDINNIANIGGLQLAVWENSLPIVDYTGQFPASLSRWVGKKGDQMRRDRVRVPAPVPAPAPAPAQGSSANNNNLFVSIPGLSSQSLTNVNNSATLFQNNNNLFVGLPGLSSQSLTNVNTSAASHTITGHTAGAVVMSSTKDNHNRGQFGGSQTFSSAAVAASSGESGSMLGAPAPTPDFTTPFDFGAAAGGPAATTTFATPAAATTSVLMGPGHQTGMAPVNNGVGTSNNGPTVDLTSLGFQMQQPSDDMTRCVEIMAAMTGLLALIRQHTPVVGSGMHADLVHQIGLRLEEMQAEYNTWTAFYYNQRNEGEGEGEGEDNGNSTMN